MKVLFITGRFHPDVGGVENHVSAISDLLSRNGNDITIITSTTNKSIKGLEVNNGITVIRKYLGTHPSLGLLNTFADISKMILFITRNLRLIRQQDVIHLHDVISFLWIILIHFFIRQRVYITFHGFERDPVKKRDIFLRKLAERGSRSNICVGSFLKKWYGTKPNAIILGGIHEPKKCPNGGSMSAVYIGRLSEDTSVMKYLETLKILRDKYGISLPLHICGDGPSIIKMTEFAEANSMMVQFHGFVTDAYNYICQSKYVFASGYLSILEAMSYKRPVFSIYETPLKRDYYSSIPDVTHMMYVEDSTITLAEDLYRVITDPEYGKLKLERAYSFALSNKWKRISDVYLELWKKHEK